MTLNQWYNEGLLDRDIATLNGDQVTAKMTSGKAGASVGWAASRMQLFMTSAQQSDPATSLLRPLRQQRKRCGTRVWLCGKPVP